MANSKKIIDKIKKENIQPLPKWFFSTKKIGIQLLFVISAIIGATAFSIVLFAIQETDFNIVTRLTHSRVAFFLGLLPLFWIIALIIFLVAAILTIRKSGKGYKHTWFRLILVNTITSLLLGTLIFFSGGAQWLEETFAEKVSIYESIDEKKMKVWMLPEEGYLSGTIETVTSTSFLLTDFHEKEWQIEYTDAFIAGSVFLVKGERIKLVGNITGSNVFRADEVRPWGGPEHRKEMKGRRQNRQNGRN